MEHNLPVLENLVYGFLASLAELSIQASPVPTEHTKFGKVRLGYDRYYEARLGKRPGYTREKGSHFVSYGTKNVL